jgi:hypothetical protein
LLACFLSFLLASFLPFFLSFFLLPFSYQRFSLFNSSDSITSSNIISEAKVSPYVTPYISSDRSELYFIGMIDVLQVNASFSPFLLQFLTQFPEFIVEI